MCVCGGGGGPALLLKSHNLCFDCGFYGAQNPTILMSLCCDIFLSMALSYVSLDCMKLDDK